MQKNQFTDAQIVAILQQAEKGEQTITEVCRQHNVSENSFYRWRNRFGNARQTKPAACANSKRRMPASSAFSLNATWR